MATDFTQDSVLHFLQSRGGSAKNSELLLHFRGFLRDHADQVRNRDLFKRFVNSVATVRQEDGVSHVVLRKKFRGFVPGRGGAGAGAEAGSSAAPPARGGEKPRGERAAAPAGGALLPAAGIVQESSRAAEPAAVRVSPGPSPSPGPRQAPRPQPVTPGVAEPPAREQRAVRAARQTVAFAPPPELREAAPAQNLQPGPVRGEADPRPPDPRPGGRVPTDPRPPDPRPGATVPTDPRAGGGGPPDPRPGEGLPPADLQPQVRLVRHRKSYKSAVSYDDDEEEEEEEEEEVQMVVGSTVGARPPSVPLARSDRAASSPCPVDQPAPPPASSSSDRKPPKIYIQDVEAEAPPPPPPEQGAGLSEHWVGRVPVEPMPERRSLPVQRCTPSPRRAEEEEEEEEEEAELHAYKQDRRYSQPAAVQPEPGKGWSQSERARLSSSHSSVFSPSSDAGFSSSEWPPSSSPRGSGWNSSYEDFQGGAAEVGGAKVQEVLQRAQESVLHRGVVKTSAPWHRSAEQLHVDRELEARAQTLRRSTDCLHDNQLSAPKGLPWHLSTGDLYDDGESSDGSTSSPPPTLRPSAARRVSSRLRSRMCRSLGANLDQLLQEEEAGAAAGGGGGGAVGNEAARLNRLHMISSSLSLRYNLSSSSLSSCSTPPRCHSMADLTEDGDRKGRKRRSQPGSAPSASSRQDASSSQSPVPLEPHEHAWLVKGAAGAWPDIYSLFREDPSLLNRRDFISGFTVLHWIAKHGDHRVLNTLWYGVEKAGLTLDVDARSACGHTPLHLAAMHNNKNMIRLLVSKFNADVKRRDTAGKRPWQYLSKAMPLDVFQMLGAPARAAIEGSIRRGGANAAEPGHEQKQQRRHHRRRHHLSFASSGERPLTVAGKVKRSTSIAAFLKRKSLALQGLQGLQGLHSDSSV